MNKFDLKKAMNGAPVCTREGIPAKILDFDLNGRILFKRKVNDTWYTCDVAQNGMFSPKHDSIFDLFMVPSKGYVNIYISKDRMFAGEIYPSIEDCKKELSKPEYMQYQHYSCGEITFAE